jgi:hypothetical protein
MNKEFLHKRVLLKKGDEPIMDVYIHEMFDKEYFKFEILCNSEMVLDIFDLYEIVDTMNDYVYVPSKSTNTDKYKIDWEKITKRDERPLDTRPLETKPWTVDPLTPVRDPSVPVRYPWQEVWYTTQTIQANNVTNESCNKDIQPTQKSFEEIVEILRNK